VSDPGAPSVVRRLGLPGLGLSAVSLLWLALGSGLPTFGGLALAFVALALGVGLRFVPQPVGRDLAWVPIVAALGVLSITTPLTVLAELVAGLGGIAVLLWMIDDPDRLPGGVQRGLSTIALPALAVGVAWSSALLLPPGAAPLGVAAALLAFAVAIVAFFLGRPELFDREEAATS
jgi:hypothetical protein